VLPTDLGYAPTGGASWGQASNTFVSELMINRRGHSEPVRTCDRTDRDDSISCCSANWVAAVQ